MSMDNIARYSSGRSTCDTVVDGARLPTEVWLEIFSKFTAQDVLRLRLACRRFNSIISNNIRRLFVPRRCIYQLQISYDRTACMVSFVLETGNRQFNPNHERLLLSIKELRQLCDTRIEWLIWFLVIDFENIKFTNIHKNDEGVGIGTLMDLIGPILERNTSFKPTRLWFDETDASDLDENSNQLTRFLHICNRSLNLKTLFFNSLSGLRPNSISMMQLRSVVRNLKLFGIRDPLFATIEQSPRVAVENADDETIVCRPRLAIDDDALRYFAESPFHTTLEFAHCSFTAEGLFHYLKCAIARMEHEKAMNILEWPSVHFIINRCDLLSNGRLIDLCREHGITYSIRERRQDEVVIGLERARFEINNRSRSSELAVWARDYLGCA